ncbi:MAG: helix-turn-helix transcriptional regulator [Lachnospiraceae bacterium]|nr:helix-turn-helix transcriptional regulator [Lachnospiraceae bacterium]
MLRLRIENILLEQGHSKYWLYKRMELSYQNLNRIINNETSSIRFDILERISDILEVPVGDLFEKIDD